MSKVELPGVSNVGGYTISYINDGLLLCSDCANKENRVNQKEFEQFIHWEGHSLSCEECNVEIESEYGENE